MNTYKCSKLPEVYESYDAIAPQKYAGKLEGKVAPLSDIGRTIAKAFASAGASVALISRREAELLLLVDEITLLGRKGRAIPVVADVLGPNAGPKIVTQVKQAPGSVDILINNAGITRLSRISADDMERWWRVYEVNVLASVSLCNAVLPSMIERQTGIMISTSSFVQLDSLAMSAAGRRISQHYHLRRASWLHLDRVGTRDAEVTNTQMQHPAMQELFSMFGSMDPKTIKIQTPELCADTMVALAADPAYKVLTRRHTNATQPLPSILEEAQKENKGRLGVESLHLVNITSL